MPKRDHVCPQRKLIYSRVVNIVGSIEPDHRGEKSPSTEGTRTERSDGIQGCFGAGEDGTAGIDACRVVKGIVSLDAVAN
jgi:hypothetical protein